MKIIDVKNQPKVQTPHNVDVKKIYEKDTAQAMHIFLQPGESLKPHLTPVDVFFYILEGEIDVRVGEETITISKDHLVESPMNIVHCLSNNATVPGRILVIKAPKPQSAAKLL